MPSERELAHHWENVGESPGRFLGKNPVLSAHKRTVYRDLLRIAGYGERQGLVLKTDLFAEAFNQEEFLSSQSWTSRVIGVDISRNVVQGARQRLAKAGDPLGGYVVCDVNHLPFRDGAFTGIVSDSTLDHLPSKNAIRLAIVEFGRVLSNGGRLLLTIDNPHNMTFPPRPVIDLWMSLHLAPYYIGHTLGRSALKASLQNAGLRPRYETAILHYPHPDAVVRFSEALLRRIGVGRLDHAILWLFHTAERLEGSPLRFLTGRYLVAIAQKEDPLAHID